MNKKSTKKMTGKGPDSIVPTKKARPKVAKSQGKGVQKPKIKLPKGKMI